MEQIIPTLVGVVLGFVLSLVQTQITDRQSRKRQAQLVQILVREEIDYNLELLRRFRDRLNQRDTDKDILNRGEALARKLAYLPPLVWSHKLWENQASLLAVAMTKERLGKALCFHQRIDSLTILQIRLVELVKLNPPEYPEYLKSDTLTARNPLAPTAFRSAAVPIQDEFEQITNELLGKGNPIR